MDKSVAITIFIIAIFSTLGIWDKDPQRGRNAVIVAASSIAALTVIAATTIIMRG